MGPVPISEWITFLWKLFNVSVTRKCFLLLLLVLFISNNSELRLVSNRCGKTSLVFEARAYKLKHRQTEEISGMLQSYRGAMCTNLEVTDTISTKDHVESYPMDSPFY
ncbi:hypothetical protein T10_12008 [Trichinella papuae]|uniref:Uncharacterized protein n=1 Tax=Trichinella papuae TaxID=268474 RepID=A0A0V1MPM2_9BILA|nr:hypothetical protein T10_12008 [Trichinella papuae]